MKTFTTLADFRAALSALPQADAKAVIAAQTRQDQLTKPVGSLGRLEDIAVFMAGWQGKAVPQITAPQVIIFAGNHGICSRGVNPFPQEVTAQMVANFRAGGASINQFARLAGAQLSVVDIALERPTGDFSRGVAMSEAELLEALNIGAGAILPQTDMLILGEMGIGNSTTAAALSCAIFGGDPRDWVGPGTGSDAAGKALKAQVIAEALTLHQPILSDPLQVMAALGGRELAAIAGAVVAARMQRIPVMLDGFICSSAVAPLGRFAGALDHCLIGHQSTEPGHARLLQHLGKAGILSLGMRLGEGSGATVALLIVKAALEMHAGMASFAEAGISGA